jgi:hypothetical protein
MYKILVLNEDETASSFLGVILQREHFLPILADSLETALHSICTRQPDIFANRCSPRRPRLSGIVHATASVPYQ